MTEQRSAWAIGLATTTVDGRVLDTLYVNPRLGSDGAPAKAEPGTRQLRLHEATDLGGGAFAGAARVDDVREVRVFAVLTVVADLDAEPADVHDAYLRLHLLSHRLVAPNTINFDGIFGVLPNVAWTSRGAADPATLDAARLRARAAGEPFAVTSVDK